MQMVIQLVLLRLSYDDSASLIHAATKSPYVSFVGIEWHEKATMNFF